MGEGARPTPGTSPGGALTRLPFPSQLETESVGDDRHRGRAHLSPELQHQDPCTLTSFPHSSHHAPLGAGPVVCVPAGNIPLGWPPATDSSPLRPCLCDLRPRGSTCSCGQGSPSITDAPTCRPTRPSAAAPLLPDSHLPLNMEEPCPSGGCWDCTVAPGPHCSALTAIPGPLLKVVQTAGLSLGPTPREATLHIPSRPSFPKIHRLFF